MKTKIGIIGAGSMAEEHIKAFAAFDNVEISGIYSRTQRKAEELAKGIPSVNVYKDLNSMLMSKPLDIIVITVNIESTKDVCLKSFELSPNSVFLIEKPLGLNLQEAKEIYSASKLIKAFVAFNRRFYSSVLYVKDYLDRNLSEKKYIKIQDQEDLISAAEDGHSERVLENWMFANSIHLIDLILFLCSESQIEKLYIPNKWKYNNKEFCTHHVHLHFKNGDYVLYEAIWNAQGPWAVTVTTQKKRFEIKPLEKTSYQGFPSREKFDVPTIDIDSHYKPGFFLQAKDTINASMNKKNNLVSLAKAYETTKLVHQMYFGDQQS